jgi:TetR/AcrR family transcriptional regulator, repressor for uid operon
MRKADPELQSRRRAEILAGAQVCFLKSGFHQTSMQTIAAASGLSMGLLYRYFANKEAIIEAVAQQDQEAACAAITGLPDRGDVISAWTEFISEMAKIASAADYMALTTEIVAEANRSPKILAILHHNDRLMFGAIRDKLSRQQVAGSIVLPDGAEGVAEALMLVVEGLTARDYLQPGQPEKQRRTLLDRLVRAVLTP